MRFSKFQLLTLVFVLSLVGLIAFANVTFSPALAGENNGGIIPDSYIIRVADGFDAHVMANEVAAQHSAAVSHVFSYALNGFAAHVPAARLDALRNHPGVISVEPNRYVTIDGKPTNPTPTPGSGGGSQVIPEGILRIDGDLSSTASGNGSGMVDVDVAIVDTGIDSGHPDLNVVGGYNCSTGPTSGYADGHGHGTHVAGTVGALDNSIGVVGVAPGARLWAIRVLNNSGSGTWADIICGIDWVTANANVIEVANMSLGGTGSDGGSCGSDSMHQAICNAVNAGVTFVVAAGNEADDAANHTPAAYDEVITVSALADFDGETGGLGSPTCRADEDDTFANFSNYGADVDIIAPGVCINSTWKGGGYNSISGTSMASPHVAGAAALYKSTHPSASPSQVKSALQAGGNTNWDNSDDGDNTKEKLLNVGGF